MREHAAALPPNEQDLPRAHARVKKRSEILERRAAECSFASAADDRVQRCLRNLIDSLSVGVLLADSDLKVVAINPACLDLLGIPRGRFGIGVPLGEVIRFLADSGMFGPGEPEAQVARRMHLVREGRSLRIERTRRDGRVLQIRGMPLSDGGYATLYIDVTETRLNERKLIAAKSEAETASHARSELLSVASHEIRTLLSGILGMNGLLLDMELTREQRQHAMAVRDSAEAMLFVINNILDTAKLEAGKVEIERVDFDLEALVDGVLGILTPEAAAKGLAIGAVFDPQVPRSVRGDPMRLRQILLNLVGNAVKFTQSGSVQVVVTIVERGPLVLRLRFEVRDTGIGLLPGTHERLFVPFSQADSSIARRYGGTGLGLSIARQLVTLLGGEIGVESEPGAGSTFWFTTTLAPTSDAPERPGLACPHALKGLRALVIGDTEATRRGLRRELEREGMLVTEAEDASAGFVALEHAWQQGEPLDVALLGRSVPVTTSRELAERVRRDARLGGTKFLSLSRRGLPSVGDDAARVGFEAGLGKLPQRRLLVEELRLLFGRTGARPDDKRDAGLPAACARTVAGGPVLVVEDNALNRQVALSLLRKHGLEADGAENAAEAVSAAGRRDYALVLMDVTMPDLDGFEATRRIRALPARRRVPIVAMTAHAMRGDRERCLAAGMDDYVSKPIDPQAFLDTVWRWLQQGTVSNGPSPDDGTCTERDELPTLDEASVARLGGIMPPGELPALLEGWIRKSDCAIGMMRGLACAGAFTELARVAHDLAGVAGIIGIGRVGRHASLLDDACSVGNAVEVMRCVGLLEEEWPWARDALRGQVARGMASPPIMRAPPAQMFGEPRPAMQRLSVSARGTFE